jgi:hypothetical protein
LDIRYPPVNQHLLELSTSPHPIISALLTLHYTPTILSTCRCASSPLPWPVSCTARSHTPPLYSVRVPLPAFPRVRDSARW